MTALVRPLALPLLALLLATPVAAQRGAETPRSRTRRSTEPSAESSTDAESETAPTTAPTDVARELLPEGFDDDPIGTGDTHTLTEVPLQSEIPPDLTRPPEAPSVDVDQGRVLTAIPGVREVDHLASATLEGGMVRVDLELRFVNRARHAAEFRYRLPVPPGARPEGLVVCLGEDRCRTGAPDTSGAYDDAVRARGPEGVRLPVAAVDVEERGAATTLVIRAAPLSPDATTTVRLAYLAPTPTHGGITHVRLPARGRDGRVAPMRLHVRTDELLAPAVDGEPARGEGEPWHEVEAWEAVTLTGTHRSGGTQVDLVRFPCGAETCARLHAVAGPRSPRRERVVLLLDASPSMLGPARGRMGAALAALLAAMHPESEVSAYAFAGTAQALLEDPRRPDQVPLATLGRATGLDLGAATRFEAAWRALAPRRGDHVILVGDGGLTASREGLAAADAARAAGGRVSALNLADRDARPALVALVERTGGRVVAVGAEADQASRERSTARLEEKVVALTAPSAERRVAVLGSAPVELGSLAAGESLHWTGVVPRDARFVVGSERRPTRLPAAEAVALAAMAHPGIPGRLAAVAAADRSRPSLCGGGPPERAGGVSSDARPVVLAERRCAAPEPEPTPEARGLGRGVPAETVLSLLRRRVVPAARRCFRLDRAGRADYSVRAVFELELSDREVNGAAVHGEIDERLRACLMDTLDDLEVPAFEGAVLVRYPLYTERHPPPPTIELRPDVAAPLDRVLRTEPTPDRRRDEALLRR
ncbi:MAG: hypothetical protein CMN30_14370 [Sandaracinus sp.]|nr:hypothetical protein [Sandaracinus sp.]